MKKHLLTASAAVLVTFGAYWASRDQSASQQPAAQPPRTASAASTAPAVGLQPRGESPEVGASQAAVVAPAIEPEPLREIPAPELTKAPDMAKIAAFSDWTKRWQSADAATRAALTPEGRKLATERRPEFKSLIKTNPRVALEQSVPRVIRQDLPVEIVEQLETPVSARGDLNVWFGKAQPGVVVPEGTELKLAYFETKEGSYKARTYGEFEHLTTKKNIPLRGVALDREFAVADSAVRQLENGERISPSQEVSAFCPVSEIETPNAESAPVTDDAPAIEVEGRIIRLCNGTHVRVLDEKYTAGIMASGPGGAGFFKDAYPGTSSEAIGNFRCLYIRVTYPDQMREPNSETTAYSDMRNVSRFYLESSFGRMTTTSAVTPLIVMPHSKAWYIAKDSEVDGLGLVHSDARSEARKLGYDSNQYNCTIVRVNEGPRLSGISWGGGDSVWVSWNGMDVLNHECGHSLGRNHANYWTTSDGSAIGVGSNQEYGNSYDVMGGGGGFGAHYNSKSKRDLGWLDNNYVHRPGTTQNFNGIYRIVAYDQPQLEDGKRYALRVDKDAGRKFYLEYHPAVGGQWTDSVLMLIDGLGSNCGHLIDTTQGSPGGKGDGGIRVGRTFSDFESDLHFTVVSKNATTPPSMDVAVMRGPFPGNQPPTVTLNASATSVGTGVNVTFTATASDPDGDALAYHWDFSDAYVSPNASTVTRSFSSTSYQTVHLTVSDMKGGTVRAHQLITVGTPTRGYITGTISDGVGFVPGVLVTSDTNKYAYTDSNGNYTLADISTGSRTLTASKAGYTFTAGFTNPLTVVAGANADKHWSSTSVPTISLASTNATEGGAAGSFIITRTGDTSADLDVNVAPVSGTATKTTDYTFAPDYAANGSLYRFTIPAGQASLTVVVTPVNDTAQEGPETVKLQLAVGAYQARQSGLATLTIADNDTTKPVVGIVATDIYATETPGDAATFVVSRTGATTAALSVSLAYSGTATNGSDYPTGAATVSIPIGQSSATVTLTPTDDATIEVPEDATITVSTNANYIVEPGAASATATITDNDLPTVSAVALDDTLNEAARGTGSVLISRTGSTAASLKVYYGLSGRALHGTDYMALPGEVTIPAGQVSVPVILTPYDDDIGEIDESITFQLTSFGSAYSLGTAHTATLTVKDNNDGPLITVGANSASEPSSNGTFTFTANGSVTGTITVNYTLSGTATSGTDYTAPSGTVTINGNGTNTATVTIPVLDDAVLENTETIVLTITPDAAYKTYNDGKATMRLKDNDRPGIAVSTHSATLSEPTTASSFYVSRDGSTGDLVVNYTLSGTATNGTDYATLTGSVTIADGSTGADIAVTPIDDALVEGVETVTLTIAPDASLGTEVASATLYLNDNDTVTATPSVGFASSTGTTSENPDVTLGEYRDITVTLSAVMPNVVTVEYMGGGGTAQGDDVDWTYVDAANGNAVIPRGLITFNPGETSKTVRIRVKNDGVLEGNETAILELRNVYGARISGSRNVQTLTISDANNPTPRASFLVAASTRSELDSGEPLLIASLDQAATGTVTVPYTLSGTATQGSDYSLAAGTITFAAGESAKHLNLGIINDGITELSETVIVTLGTPTGATLGTVPSHTITLTEANTPIIEVAASTPLTIEGGTNGAFTITRTNGVSLNLTVNYTVTGTAGNGTDYATLSGSVLMPSGQASVVVPVAPIDDTELETDETVIVALAADLNYEVGTNSSATVTIFDNDTPPTLTLLSPEQRDVAVPSGVGLVVQAQATRITPEGEVQQPITWSHVSGPATATIQAPGSNETGVIFPSDGLYVIRATSGTTALATLDLTVSVGTAFYPTRDIGTPTVASNISQSGSTYTLSAAGSGLSGAGTADGFYFVSVPMTGDFDVKTRIVSTTNPGASSSNRIGLMARESFATGARYAMSHHRGDGVHSYNYRLTTNAATANSTGSTVYTMPRWLRLTRVGDVFAAYYSADGTTWSQRGSNQTITMGSTCYVGLALTSAVAATPSTAVFDNLSFTPVVNVGPNVNAGPALTGSGPWTTDGTVTDDSKPAGAALSLLWSTYSGIGTASFTNASTADTAVTFPASGSYTLRLTVDDTHTKTFDDTTASVTSLPPIESWRQAKFGANASNPAIAGDTADPDGDGFNNLLEYGLNLNPLAGNAASEFPSASYAADTLSITYRRRVDATDITYTVQGSPNAGGSYTTVAVNETVLSDDGQTRVIRATPTSPSGTDYFLRLKISTVDQ